MMMQFYALLCVSVFAVVSLEGCVAAVNPSKPIEIKVVDEDGHPVESVTVTYIFNGVTVNDNVHKRAKTNQEGIVEESGPSYFGAYIQITKDGYYKSTIDRVRDDRDAEKWSLEVVLREIRSPVAMFAKKVRSYVPAENVRVGYDLTMGDWISPYGNGTVSHMYFTYSGTFEDYSSYEGQLQLSFSNAGDGLIEIVDPYRELSSLKLPHEAPSRGYRETKYWTMKASKQQSADIDSYNGELSYYFRVNTTLDEKGNVISANYGKIYGDIRFQLIPETQANGRGPGYVSFTYYFNPTPNDRNVEFDPTKNLLTEEVKRADWRVTEP